MRWDRILLIGVCVLAGTPQAATLRAGPGNLEDQVSRLGPGDTLLLAPGRYPGGLRVHDLHGGAGRPIVIDGGGAAALIGRPGRNVLSIKDASHVVIRNLEIDGRGAFVDAVKAEGHASFAHHITLENLHIHSLAAEQLAVGISTKCPAWAWVIRGNRIEGAGTGMYLGNSDGRAPFVGGLIEDNQVLDSIGYNLQVKHQNPRPRDLGMPETRQRTIIRRNLFVKSENSSAGPAARPNVLVGHFPLEGPGQDDEYIIYGNTFLGNPTEALFQGEGNIALYNNLFFNGHPVKFPAIAIQPHNDIPRRIRIFFNTIVHPKQGIRVLLDKDRRAGTQRLFGNLVYADQPLSGGRRTENLGFPFELAHEHLCAPVADRKRLDLRPATTNLTGRPLSHQSFSDYPEADVDFAGRQREGLHHGAYVGGAGC